ncbi:FAD/NAD(P)-binding domain-containing protein [Gymnopus androsaceus JB14]|uniref:FAD/NAD(P)-binding domain-containing protein n=1 Tax=Gymnopus androsaceus JB14 TaxID=1447944 RepID=A0A6A4H1Y6_9AGAR|nr:FAD/NAD(P)-binding domain-containing protein [Gymnopus androsaceus JB14]
MAGLQDTELDVPVLNSVGFSAASDLGGVWYDNAYPGARVDSDNPFYQLAIPDLWQDWTWKERYPGRKELLEYFRYVDRKLDIKKDVYLNTRVVAVHFDQQVDRWIVTTEGGLVVRPRFFVLSVGFSSKSHSPDFKGLEKFKGICHHSSQWPQEDADVKNKRVGVVGTGATAVRRSASLPRRLSMHAKLRIINAARGLRCESTGTADVETVKECQALSIHPFAQIHFTANACHSVAQSC